MESVSGAINTPAAVNNVLLVELISFSGEANDEGVSLFWNTATEENLEKFEILRSVDLINFQTIGEVKAFGNSSDIQNYFHFDAEPTTGINYYRLKMLDEDGLFEYSEIIAIDIQRNVKNTNVELVIYPNPVTENVINFNILAEDEVNVNRVLMYDMMGQLYPLSDIQNSSQKNSGTIVIPKSIEAGLYILSLETEMGTYKKKFILR